MCSSSVLLIKPLISSWQCISSCSDCFPSYLLVLPSAFYVCVSPSSLSFALHNALFSFSSHNLFRLSQQLKTGKKHRKLIWSFMAFLKSCLLNKYSEDLFSNLKNYLSSISCCNYLQVTERKPGKKEKHIREVELFLKR